MCCKTEEICDVSVSGGVGMCNAGTTVLVIHGVAGCGKSRLSSEIMRFAEEQCGWETYVGLEGFGDPEVLVLDEDESPNCVSDLAQLLDRGVIDGRFGKRSVALPKLVIIETQRDLDDSDFAVSMSQLSRLCRCVSLELSGLVVA